MSRRDPAKVRRLRRKLERTILGPFALIARGLFRKPGEPGSHKESGTPVDDLSDQAKHALTVVFGSLDAAKEALAAGREPDYGATMQRLAPSGAGGGRTRRA